MATAAPAEYSGWRPSRSRLLGAACWLLALAAIGLIVWRSVIHPMVDLSVYRSGASTVLHGGRLYAMRTAIGLVYTYPPVAAILAAPLALVSFPVARLAWVPMVYGPLAIAVWISFRPLLARAGRSGPAAFAVILGGSALLLPVRQEMGFGQIDLFLLALCLVDCTAMRPRWPRGLLIGLATAIKLVPGVFIIYLLITRRRRDAAVAALSFAGWTALTWLLDPRDSVTYWTSAIFDARRLGGNASAGNQSVRGMILRAFLPGPMPAAAWLAAAALVGIAGFAAARASWRRGNDMAGIAITGLLAAALSPVAWIHHFCWVVVAIGVIAGDGRNRSRVTAAVLTFALFVSSLPIWTEVLMQSPHHPAIPGPLLENSFGLAALALILVLSMIRATDTELLAWHPAPASSFPATGRPESVPAAAQEAPTWAG